MVREDWEVLGWLEVEEGHGESPEWLEEAGKLLGIFRGRGMVRGRALDGYRKLGGVWEGLWMVRDRGRIRGRALDSQRG